MPLGVSEAEPCQPGGCEPRARPGGLLGRSWQGATPEGAERLPWASTAKKNNKKHKKAGKKVTDLLLLQAGQWDL